MQNLEALTQRKEQLLLEMQIADLERKQKFSQTTASWSWWWITPLAILGVFSTLSGLVIASFTQSAEPAFLMTCGLVALVPMSLKLLSLRS